MPYLMFRCVAGLLRLQNGRCSGGCGEGSSAALRQHAAPYYGTRKYLLRLLSNQTSVGLLHRKGLRGLYEQPNMCILRGQDI